MQPLALTTNLGKGTFSGFHGLTPSLAPGHGNLGMANIAKTDRLGSLGSLGNRIFATRLAICDSSPCPCRSITAASIRKDADPPPEDIPRP